MMTSRASGTELLSQLGKADDRAFQELHDRYGARVVRYAWAVSPSRDAVHELVQDTFMTMWLKGASLELTGTSLLPWLLVTCRNHAANRRRKDARWAAMTDLDENIADHRLAAADQLKWVIQEIEALPETDRLVVDLCLLQGFTYAEAAAQIGSTPAAVGKRLQRARAMLKGGSK